MARRRPRPRRVRHPGRQRDAVFWPAEGLALGLPAADGALDRATKTLVAFGFEGKPFTVFSLLSGVGLGMQLGGDRPLGLVIRRLLLLGVIGALHVTLAWWGDILLFYGLIGLASVAASRWSPRRLLRGAVAMALLPIVAVGLLAGLATLTSLDGAASETVAQGQEATRAGYARDFAAAVEVVRHGSWGEQVAARWSAYAFAAAGTALTGMRDLRALARDAPIGTGPRRIRAGQPRGRRTIDRLPGVRQ